MRNIWTESEIEFIRENYTHMSDKELSNALGTHSESGVATKRKSLKCHRPKNKYTFDDVIKAFQEKGYFLLSKEEDYQNTCTKLDYICPHHQDKGIQKITMGHLIGGEGCYYCGREKVEQLKRDLISQEQILDLCDRRGFVYQGKHYKDKCLNILFICKTHPEAGVQSMRYRNMLRDGYGCRYCAKIKYSKESKGEREISSILTNNNIVFLPQFIFKGCRDIMPLPFDFYLTDFNICIEFDGEHHFRPVQFNGISAEHANDNFLATQKHDKMKNDFCQNNNIPLIRIPYTYRGKIFNFLQGELFNYNVHINNQ